MQKMLCVGNLVLLSVIHVGSLFAQASVSDGAVKLAPPTFDVVSIRQIETMQNIKNAGGLLTVTTAHKNCQYAADRVDCQLPLKNLIEEAFQLKKTEMAGLGALSDNLFVVQARMPPGTSTDDARSMLRQVLVERFGLEFHREERIEAVYALIPGKRGVKLHPADDLAHRKLLDVPTPAGRGAKVFMSPGQFSASAMSLDALADVLNSMAGIDLPVVNMTGLTGEYKIDLHWTPVEEEEPSLSLKILDAGFPDAVQNELGLKLEKRRAPTTVFVVDKADLLPSAN